MGRYFRQRWASILLTGCLAALASNVTAIGEEPIVIDADWVLRGGLVIDGTGGPARQADVAIRGDRIVAVGTIEPGASARVLDVTKLVVAPGFIDLHTHSDRTILSKPTRSNRNYLAQGVTTIVTGNCGSGPIDVGSYLRQVDDQGAGTNVIHLVPHGSVRRSVLGNADVQADEKQLARMKEIVERGMSEGAWGMSTGLIYLPGRYADTQELIELAKVVAGHGGIYASHIRNEGAGLLDAIDEAIQIGAGPERRSMSLISRPAAGRTGAVSRTPAQRSPRPARPA